MIKSLFLKIINKFIFLSIPTMKNILNIYIKNLLDH